MQVRLRMACWQPEELKHVGVFQGIDRIGVRLSQRCRDFWGLRHCALEQGQLELALELPTGPLFTGHRLQVELALFRPLGLANNHEVVRPGNLSQQCRDFYAGAGNGLVELAHAKKVGS